MLEVLKRVFLNLYLQYELITCIYMFEPWEKKLINGLVAVIASLILFSSCVYLPSYIETFLQFISPLPLDAKAPATAYAPMLQADKINLS